jgi:cellulose synthase/poly-beta-1,6-N-acetylglucosamine synthase-like glycosyltransferase
VHRAAIVFWVSAAALGYIYAGYPAILAAMQRLRARRNAIGWIEPKVCLFIAANDEAPVIEAKLQNALALDYPAGRLDIVVASDGSVDGTNAIVRRFAPRVRLLEFTPRRGKVAVINEGLASIDADVVVFTDANTFLDPQAVRALVCNFADPEVGAVSGDVALVGERAALGRSEDLYYRYERWVQNAESEIGSMIGVDGALYAIRRDLFAPVAADTILDDMAIPMAVVRAGKRVVFEPAARAREQGSETAKEEFARKSRVIAGAVQFMARRDSSVPLGAPQVIFSMISHKALRWLSPAFATGALLSSVALASSSNSYAAAAAVQGLLLLVGLAGCAPAARRSSVVAIAHYFCLVQAAAAVGFVRGLTGHQSVLWRRFERVQAPAVVQR